MQHKLDNSTEKYYDLIILISTIGLAGKFKD